MPNDYKEEVGWLLERRVDGKILWCMVEAGEWGWTDDSLRALRFARHQDAEAMSEIVSDTEFVTEHIWGP